jgi:hypothetical protein
MEDDHSIHDNTGFPNYDAVNMLVQVGGLDQASAYAVLT